MAGPEHPNSLQDIEARRIVMGGIYKEVMLKNGTLAMEKGSETHKFPVLKTPHTLFGEVCEGNVFTIIKPEDEANLSSAESACDHCAKPPEFMANFTREELENKLTEDRLREQTEKRIRSIGEKPRKPEESTA